MTKAPYRPERNRLLEHLNRYVAKFAGRHHVRTADATDQMSDLTASLAGKQLMCRDLLSG